MDELTYDLFGRLFVESEDDFMAETETNTNDYLAWAAEMDTQLKAALIEDELAIEAAFIEDENDKNDEFYACYKGVVKPRVYGNCYENENMQAYDEVIDNCKPINPIFE